MASEGHIREVARLYTAFKRDYWRTVEGFAGLSRSTETEAQRDSRDNAALRRLQRTWDALCRLDINFAAAIAHGTNEVDLMLQRHGDPTGPFEHNLRGLAEIAGIAKLGRDANPHAEVKTLGELVELGEAEIQRQVEEDTR